jgi:hypothetical protein
MILPIYVSLEKIDTRLAEAAQDLYNLALQCLSQESCLSRCPECLPAAC